MRTAICIEAHLPPNNDEGNRVVDSIEFAIHKIDASKMPQSNITADMVLDALKTRKLKQGYAM